MCRRKRSRANRRSTSLCSNDLSRPMRSRSPGKRPRPVCRSVAYWRHPWASTAHPYAIALISRGERKAPDACPTITAQQPNRGTQIIPKQFGFPAVLEHDTIVPQNLCGGPVVDVDGHDTGVNIAPASRTTT